MKCNNSYQTKAAKTNHEKFCGTRKIKILNNNCPKCNMIIHTSYDNHIKSCDGFGPRRRSSKPKVVNAAINMKGKTYVDMYGIEKSDSIKKRLSDLNKLNPAFKGNEHTEASRSMISSTMKKNPSAGGIRKGSGRGKSGWYKGNWCDSTWELAWVIYNIENSIKFERNNTGFEYIYNGETKRYYPDFIIDNEYYEIKGRRNYESLDDKNKAKIDTFNHGVLNVLYSKEIKQYIDYAILKYGKNFYKLYE